MKTTQYKQTDLSAEQAEIGKIPADWEVKKLGEICDVVGGGTPSTTNSEFWNGNINWFTPSEIGKSKYAFVSERKIAQQGLEKSSAKMLPIGTILLTSRATIGDVSILKEKGCTNQGFQSLIAKKNTDNEFLYYLALTLKNELLRNASGSTFLEITPTKIRKIQIPLPTDPAEQTRIAAVLSDIDALLAALDKKIEKKKQIKQGAMHKLLSPPACAETADRQKGDEWVMKKLGEVAELKNGYGFKSANYSDSGNYLVITIANVQDGYMDTTDCNKIVNLPSDIQQFQRLKNDDLLVSMTGNVGRVCKVNKNNCLLNQRVGLLNVKDADANFLFHILHTDKFIADMIKKSQGGAQANLGKGDIESFEITIPKSKVVQQKIAAILSDMDTEIAVLEREREKYAQIKAGMMSELLTGKTRLV